MRVAVLFIVLILPAVVLFADDRSVDFDRHTDFSTLKSFAVREGKVDSPSPELDNPLLLKNIADAIRAELTSRGLKETVNNPHIIADYSISGQNFSAERGGPISISEGTLVIDLTNRESKALIWRGVYRDSEKNNAKLALELRGDVKKLLSEYPPKQKGVIEPGRSTLAPVPKLSPKAAAVATLEIIQAARLSKDFVGENNHPGLSISLTMLERAARAVSEDNGRSPGAATTKTIAFYEALSNAADYAASIADRGVETVDARAKARALANRLRSLSAD